MYNYITIIFLLFSLFLPNIGLSFNDIMKAQNILTELGYEPGPVDGVWGGKTKKALNNFYQDRNKKFNGILDLKEMSDLEVAFNKFLKTRTKFENINHSTERYRRSQIMCKIATEDNLKPFPTGIDDFRSSPDMSTYADLYGDGSIEFITGVSDSTFLLENQKFPYEGNEKRATGPSEHRIYSPQPNFKLDLSLLFHNAHLITSDLNRDGVDDIVFIQQGLDFPPWSPEWNYILMSSGQKYRLKKLPGKKSSFHGGTAGDIDNDGDIDIIAVPGFENRVTAYINDGRGKFMMRTIAGPKNIKWGKLQYFFAGLWDFDEDGFLDLILGSQLDHTKIIWGNGDPNFNGPQTIVGDINDYYMDFEFADFNNDGKKELITFGGNYNPNVDYQHHYKGWHIQKIDLEDRKVKSIKSIERFSWHSNKFFQRFSACDIQKDSDLDLVYERNSQFKNKRVPIDFNFTTVTRIIWFNKKGQFKRVRIEDPFYYRSYDVEKRNAVKEHAKKLGTTSLRYKPKQRYYEYKGKGNYIHDFRRPVAQPFLDKAH